MSLYRVCTKLLFGLAASIGAFASIAFAQPVQNRPEAFQKLLDCKPIADATERLACYDRQVAAMETAESDSSLVIVDKKQIRQAKKGLFGLSLPSMNGLLGRGDKDEDDDVDAIETVIKSARLLPSGRWLIVLADDARWVQTETKSIFDPKPGQKIRIRKAAMGSFFANINGQTAIRMSRQNQ
jgi:hypothetical protein